MESGPSVADLEGPCRGRVCQLASRLSRRALRAAYTFDRRCVRTFPHIVDSVDRLKVTPGRRTLRHTRIIINQWFMHVAHDHVVARKDLTPQGAREGGAMVNYARLRIVGWGKDDRPSGLNAAWSDVEGLWVCEAL